MITRLLACKSGTLHPLRTTSPSPSYPSLYCYSELEDSKVLLQVDSQNCVLTGLFSIRCNYEGYPGSSATWSSLASLLYKGFLTVSFAGYGWLVGWLCSARDGTQTVTCAGCPHPRAAPQPQPSLLFIFLSCQSVWLMHSCDSFETVRSHPIPNKNLKSSWWEM